MDEPGSANIRFAGDSQKGKLKSKIKVKNKLKEGWKKIKKKLNNGFEPMFFDYKTNTLT